MISPQSKLNKVSGAVVAVNVLGEVGAACANLVEKFGYVVYAEGKTTINQTACIRHEQGLKASHSEKKKNKHHKNHITI